MGQDQLGRHRTQRFIDKLYSGSAKAMAAALVEHDQLGPRDVDELREYFRRLRDILAHVWGSGVSAK